MSRPFAAAQEHAGVQITAVVLLAIFWSVNWPIMKIGLTVVEPWTFRAVLVLVGAVGCLALAAAAGDKVRVPRADWAPLIAVGLVQGVLWNAFSGFGIALIDAGRASVLAFTMPVWATFLSVVFLGERPTRTRLLGLAFGMGGMALLIAPSLGAVEAHAVGSFLMIGGAISWAVATIVVKKHDWTISPLVLSGWQFAIGALPLSVAAFLIGEPGTLLNLDGITFAAMSYSALVPMIFCQAIFFTLVRRLPASIASMGTLLVPPMGVMFSALILGEVIRAGDIAALALVLCAMLLILPGFNWRSAASSPARPHRD